MLGEQPNPRLINVNRHRPAFNGKQTQPRNGNRTQKKGIVTSKNIVKISLVSAHDGETILDQKARAIENYFNALLLRKQNRSLARTTNSTLDMVKCRQGSENPNLRAALTGFHPVEVVIRYRSGTSALSQNISAKTIADIIGLSDQYFLLRRVEGYVVANDPTKQLGLASFVHVHEDAQNGILGSKWEDLGRANECHSYDVTFMGEGQVIRSTGTANIVTFGASSNIDLTAYFHVTCFI